MDKKLNKEQLQAIKHKKGPLLIIAGAGTGKTTVITERIKYLISKGFAKPEEILALTFTEKGATEMQERVDVALPLGYSQMWIMTFHSFCDQVLRQSGIHAGIDPEYDLLTGAESVDLLKKNIFDLNLDYFRPLGNPNKFLEGLLQHFSRLQDENITVKEYIDFAKKYKNEDKLEVKKINELANAYEKYNSLKIKKSLMDFGDLITNTLRLFKERPNVLKEYIKKFKYILIDEFQDTNYSQNELAILLAGNEKNITVVADDDQAIYRWRGAAVSNVIQFRKNFPETEIIVLTKNYRSSQTILDKSYDLIQHNNPNRLEILENINKKLISINFLASKTGKRLVSSLNNNKKDNIKFIHTQNFSDEVGEVSEEIIALTSKGYYVFSDIAILVRANNHAQGFIREFERRGIPHQFLGPSKLFEREEIIDLISYLKVLYNPEDSGSFYRLISSDLYDIEPIDLIKISSFAKRKSSSIFEVIAENNALNIKKDSKEKLESIMSILNKHLKVVNKLTAGELLYDYIKEIGLLEKLVEKSDDVKAKNISKFFDKIKAYEDENNKSSLFDVVEYIDLLTEVGESPIVTDGDWHENMAVNILTVHSSKGLEFPVVFLVNLVNERFPSRERHEQIPIPEELIKETLPDGDFHLQEERRLFYVAMTRAKEKLYLTASNYYGDGKREKKISPFVYEVMGDMKDKLIQKATVFKIDKSELNRKIGKKKLVEKLKIDYLSVSQIETFKACPLHYKLKYIYKIVTPPQASISFGISIHNTLKDFYSLEEKENNENSDVILKIYKDNFIEDGYLNKKHKQEFYEKGKIYLQGFLKNGYNKNIKTIALEQKFVIPVANDLKIGGAIDRVDDLGQGEYEIIDYKTGANIPTQKEVDKDLQLSFYCLAVSDLYKVNPDNIKLSLYFLDTQEKISAKRTIKQLEEVKKEIIKIRKEMEESDFKCNESYFCQQGCEFKMFCSNNN